MGSKGLKVKPGISKFNRKPRDIPEYLRPLFAHAASLIPEDYHHKTKIYLKATAGVRLLPLEEQTVMFDTLHEALEVREGWCAHDPVGSAVKSPITRNHRLLPSLVPE